METKLTDKEMDIVGHTLGVNVYHARLSKKKKDKKLPKEFYRNYFCAGTESHDEFTVLATLEKRGYMRRMERMDQLYFYVTDTGKEIFTNQFNEQISLSK